MDPKATEKTIPVQQLMDDWFITPNGTTHAVPLSEDRGGGGHLLLHSVVATLTSVVLFAFGSSGAATVLLILGITGLVVGVLWVSQNRLPHSLLTGICVAAGEFALIRSDASQIQLMIASSTLAAMLAASALTDMRNWMTAERQFPAYSLFLYSLAIAYALVNVYLDLPIVPAYLVTGLLVIGTYAIAGQRSPMQRIYSRARDVFVSTILAFVAGILLLQVTADYPDWAQGLLLAILATSPTTTAVASLVGWVLMSRPISAELMSQQLLSAASSTLALTPLAIASVFSPWLELRIIAGLLATIILLYILGLIVSNIEPKKAQRLKRRRWLRDLISDSLLAFHRSIDDISSAGAGETPLRRRTVQLLILDDKLRGSVYIKSSIQTITGSGSVLVTRVSSWTSALHIAELNDLEIRNSVLLLSRGTVPNEDNCRLHLKIAGTLPHVLILDARQVVHYQIPTFDKSLFDRYVPDTGLRRQLRSTTAFGSAAVLACRQSTAVALMIAAIHANKDSVPIGRAAISRTGTTRFIPSFLLLQEMRIRRQETGLGVLDATYRWLHSSMLFAMMVLHCQSPDRRRKFPFGPKSTLVAMWRVIETSTRTHAVPEFLGSTMADKLQVDRARSKDAIAWLEAVEKCKVANRHQLKGSTLLKEDEQMVLQAQAVYAISVFLVTEMVELWMLPIEIGGGAPVPRGYDCLCLTVSDGERPSVVVPKDWTKDLELLPQLRLPLRDAMIFEIDALELDRDHFLLDGSLCNERVFRTGALTRLAAWSGIATFLALLLPPNSLGLWSSMAILIFGVSQYVEARPDRAGVSKTAPPRLKEVAVLYCFAIFCFIFRPPASTSFWLVVGSMACVMTSVQWVHVYRRRRAEGGRGRIPLAVSVATNCGAVFSIWFYYHNVGVVVVTLASVLLIFGVLASVVGEGIEEHGEGLDESRKERDDSVLMFVSYDQSRWATWREELRASPRLEMMLLSVVVCGLMVLVGALLEIDNPWLWVGAGYFAIVSVVFAWKLVRNFNRTEEVDLDARRFPVNILHTKGFSSRSAQSVMELLGQGDGYSKGKVYDLQYRARVSSAAPRIVIVADQDFHRAGTGGDLVDCFFEHSTGMECYVFVGAKATFTDSRAAALLRASGAVILMASSQEQFMGVMRADSVLGTTAVLSALSPRFSFGLLAPGDSRMWTSRLIEFSPSVHCFLFQQQLREAHPAMRIRKMFTLYENRVALATITLAALDDHIEELKRGLGDAPTLTVWIQQFQRLVKMERRGDELLDFLLDELRRALTEKVIDLRVYLPALLDFEREFDVSLELGTHQEYHNDDSEWLRSPIWVIGLIWKVRNVWMNPSRPSSSSQDSMTTAVLELLGSLAIAYTSWLDGTNGATFSFALARQCGTRLSLYEGTRGFFPDCARTVDLSSGVAVEGRTYVVARYAESDGRGRVVEGFEVSDLVQLVEQDGFFDLLIMTTRSPGAVEYKSHLFDALASVSCESYVDIDRL